MAKLFAAVFVVVLSFTPVGIASTDYDIRDDQTRADVIERHRERAGRERNERIREKKERIHGAAERVQGEVPGLAIGFSNHTGAPELVTIERGRQRLTGRSNEPREHVVRGFLQRNADLFGLSAREVAQLKKTADYANPAGNIAWVELQQELNGLPVFGGNIRFALTTDGELVHGTGNLVPALDDFPEERQPAITAAQALAIAAESIGVTVAPVLIDENGTTSTFARGPFAQDIIVRLEYFPLDGGIVTLAWSMILSQPDAVFYTYVGAEDGELLWRKNLLFTQSQPATYVVYDGDSPSPLSPTNMVPGSGFQPPLVPRTSFTVISENTFNSLGWMTDGTSITTGNNADVGLDLVAPDGIDAGTRATGTSFRVFDYAYNPPPGDPAPGDAPSLANFRFGEVVHLFFWANRYHDRLYELGFTEAARNFQQDNFGRGGLGNDRLIVEGQDFSFVNNAAFAAAPDGTSGKIQMFLWNGPDPDRSGGLDQEILLHEFTHGTSTRLHGNATGLSNAGMGGGMGEGWSDFYARALLSGPEEDVSGVYPIAAYSTLLRFPGHTDNYYYGGRRFPYALISTLGPNGRPHNPLTFADVDPVQFDLSDGAYPRGPGGAFNPFEVHAMGEIWCSTLLEMRARLIQRLGWATGNQLTLQLVTDGMKLDPLNPNFLQGRNAILTANFASATASAATEADIWRGFAARGMGLSSRINNATTGLVVEAFDVPNITVGNVTLLSDSCGGNGIPDPGETISLSMTLTNPFQLNDINDAVVTVGTSSSTLGPLVPGQSVTRTFPFTIPSTAGCGYRYDIPIVVTSAFGTVTRTHTVQLGLATVTTPLTLSSGPIALPIGDLQTVEVPFVVSASGPITEVSVSLRLNHTAVGDLAISLVAPDGTIVPLAVRRGILGDNFGSGPNDCTGAATTFTDNTSTAISAGVAPFNGAFRPESPLNALFGREMQGVWKVRVTDLLAVNTGVIGCVTLQLARHMAFCCGVPGTPVIFAIPPATLVSECSIATNNAVDPGEIVTMNFTLANGGSGATSNLVATLLPGGGVTPISGPQSYGVLIPIATLIARPFEFAVSPAVACGSDVIATFALSDNGLDLGTVSFNVRTGLPVTNVSTFSNATPIQIPASGGGATTGAPATPYPSTITVSGVPAPMTGATLTIHNFSHTSPSDVDLLLVGPGGQRFIVLADLGGFNDAVNATMTFDDTGVVLPSTFVSGTFRAGNGVGNDLFPLPAPPPPYQSPGPSGGATFTTVFNGANPNGTWSLYVVDDAPGADIGAIAGGWSLAIRTTTRVCATVAPPVITGAAANPPSLWPPNHQMEDVTVSYTTGGDCTQCSLSVTSSEPINGTGDGDTAPDFEVVDAHHVRLRAERAGNETSRIYTIAITCANGAGTTVQTVPVVVSHDGR